MLVLLRVLLQLLVAAGVVGAAASNAAVCMRLYYICFRSAAGAAVATERQRGALAR